MFICFNEDVGGEAVGNSGDYSKLLALPEGCSNLNFNKSKAVWAKQHTSGLNRAQGCNLTSAVELWFFMGYSLPWGLVHHLSGFSDLPPDLPCLGSRLLCSWLMPRALCWLLPGRTISSVDFNKPFRWE